MTQRLSQTTLIAISMLMLDPAETSRVARTGSRRTKPSRRARWFLIAILALLALLSISVKAAAEVVAGDRIVSSLDNPAVSPIRNNVHPLARRGADRCNVDDTLQLNRAMLMFRQTPAQQSDLDGLLADQMNPSSPNYHKWLTPEQFADRFGMSSNDLNKVTRWLREQGLTVVEVARSRTWVAFSGSAQQIAATLHTEIHHYNVNGTEHYANTVDPSLPAELAKVVLGVRFLD